MNKLLAVLFVGILTCSGCKSVSSTFLHRDEGNNSWKRMPQLPGVPITLEVPTHVKVDITESHFYQFLPDKGLSRIKLTSPIRDVNYTLIYDQKIFTVDMKRPASGTIQAEYDFIEQKNDDGVINEAQYFKSLNTSTTDTTIKDVASLINTIGTKLIPAPVKTSDPGAKIGKAVKEIKSVVASEIFSLDDPVFEEMLTQFMHQHLNCCHSCNSIAPEVDNPVFLPLPEDCDVCESCIVPGKDN